MSGGLPHSEIAGSKAILASPTLIAEYHVLHRLLLPRHPPNALLALDLIQKKNGSSSATVPSYLADTTADAIRRSRLNQKHTFPHSPLVQRREYLFRILVRAEPEHIGISILDLE